MTNAALKKHIGKHLQAKRKEAGFKSARAFAEHMNINVGTYTSYEQGQHSFSVETGWAFADEFGCTLDELCGHSTPPRTYSDPRQAKMNGCFETLNEESKTEVAGIVASIAADPERRIVKDGAPGLEDGPETLERIA